MDVFWAVLLAILNFFINPISPLRLVLAYKKRVYKERIALLTSYPELARSDELGAIEEIFRMEEASRLKDEEVRSYLGELSRQSF